LPYSPVDLLVARMGLSNNNRNRFIFNREEKSLHLHFFDLVGNFQIDWKESERILKDVVKIKDKNQSVML